MKMLKLSTKSRTLNFKFEAGTSRGSLKEHYAHYIIISDGDKSGVGECSPLKGLSIDYLTAADKLVELTQQEWDLERLKSYVYSEALDTFPSVRFALEVAMLDYTNGGQYMIFDNDFYHSGQVLPINGLIWMGDEDFMRRQIQLKLEQGFKCIKMKIGAINWDVEYQLLKEIRASKGGEELVLRVDANGAFDDTSVLDKLNALSELNIHSIEQPIKAGQWEFMRELCKKTPVPIALDEELINVNPFTKGVELLDCIKPQYLILKPTLLGGIKACQEWIRLAEERSIEYWFTSALESNIGLNAIAQLCAEYKVQMPQGLGTGQLYHNNIEGPLTVNAFGISYNELERWHPVF